MIKVPVLMGAIWLAASVSPAAAAGLPRSLAPGFVLVGAAALGLSSFMLYWGLAP